MTYINDRDRYRGALDRGIGEGGITMQTQIEALSGELYTNLGLTAEDTLNIGFTPRMPFRVNIHLHKQFSNVEFMIIADRLMAICGDNINSAYHYHGTIFHVGGRSFAVYNYIRGVNGLDWVSLCEEIPITDGSLLVTLQGREQAGTLAREEVTP